MYAPTNKRAINAPDGVNISFRLSFKLMYAFFTGETNEMIKKKNMVGTQEPRFSVTHRIDSIASLNMSLNFKYKEYC